MSLIPEYKGLLDVLQAASVPEKEIVEVEIGSDEKPSWDAAVWIEQGMDGPVAYKSMLLRTLGVRTPWMRTGLKIYTGQVRPWQGPGPPPDLPEPP